MIGNGCKAVKIAFKPTIWNRLGALYSREMYVIVPLHIILETLRKAVREGDIEGLDEREG